MSPKKAILTSRAVLEHTSRPFNKWKYRRNDFLCIQLASTVCEHFLTSSGLMKILGFMPRPLTTKVQRHFDYCYKVKKWFYLFLLLYEGGGSSCLKGMCKMQIQGGILFSKIKASLFMTIWELTMKCYVQIPHGCCRRWILCERTPLCVTIAFPLTSTTIHSLMVREGLQLNTFFSNAGGPFQTDENPTDPCPYELMLHTVCGIIRP